MLVKGDGHVHLYPAYHVALALTRLLANCHWLGPKPAAGVTEFMAAFLLAGRNSLTLAQLLERQADLAAVGIQMAAGPEPQCLTLTFFETRRLCLLAGRQIVTRERLELLGLILTEPIPDGLPAEETISRITAPGGIPVLAWAPGKWFLRRGQIVRRILDEAPPGQLVIGDTALRPRGWPMPSLMRRARRRGFLVLGGSDPLPVAGEEQRIGTYGFSYAGPFDATHPATSFRQILTGAAGALQPAGRRGGWGSVALRLLKNQQIRHNS